MNTTILHREVFQDCEFVTYRELLRIEGRTAQVQIARSDCTQRAQIDLWAQDERWSLVATLPPCKPDPNMVLKSLNVFAGTRDELVRLFVLTLGLGLEGG